MSSEEGKRGRQRVFLAIDLPDGVRAGLARWGEVELVDPALRPVRPGSLHATLIFLGGREAVEVEEIAAAIAEIDTTPVLMKLEDPITLPRRKKAALFALPAPSPAAFELHHAVARRLVEAGLYGGDDRDYWPHVTVARMRSEGRGSRRPAGVARRPGDLPERLKEPFYAVRLTLYRSVLQPEGSRYVPLAQVELP
jgi:RNA 2',3'-cyclic 3'-phosphodiesterase